VLHDFGGAYAVSAVVAFLFAITGPVVIILAVGARGGADADRDGDGRGRVFLRFGVDLVLALRTTLSNAKERPALGARGVRAAQTTVRRRRSEKRGQVAEQREAKDEREHDGSDFSEC
jgi:hypothetical protein